MEAQPRSKRTPDDADPRQRVLALLRRHGRSTTSFQVLEPGFHYWFAHDDACVAYADTGAAWIAAGPPIAAPSDIAATARSFVAHARKHHRRASFFAVHAEFAHQADLATLAIGEDAEWDLASWPETLRRSRSLREQLRRAKAKGLHVRVVPSDEVTEGQPLRQALDALIAGWLASRPMAAMGFLVDVCPFDFAKERVYLVAERDGRLVGFLAAVPIYERSGFFVEDLLRTHDAPNGTAELLVDLAFRTLLARGVHTATLGLAPLSGQVSPALRFISRMSKPLYNFDGVRAFKARLGPSRWITQHLAFPRGVHPFWPIRDALTAFATGGFWRFGLETLSKQRRLVVLVLGALLLPWTLMLAMASVGSTWFPSSAVRSGWLVFDLLLAVALLSLFWTWRRGLVRVLTVAIGVDAALTTAQVVSWNAPRAEGVLGWLTIVISLIAPLAASSFLIYAQRRDKEPKHGSL
jgi:lysylphosphatidylglycerol synthetase-like protein (DUF2156 family)